MSILEDKICDISYNSYGMPIIRTPWGKTPLIYADTTASGIPYRAIDDYIRCRVLPFYANVHSNGYSGKKMAHLLSQSKTAIRKSIGASKDDALIFTGSGCSSAVVHAIHALDLPTTELSGNDRPVVIITDSEHYSNFLPWKELPVDLILCPTLANGLINLVALKQILDKYKSRKIRISSMTAASNVTGIIQPIKELTDILKSAGWIVCFDFACSAPYVPICMRPENGYNIDCLFISPHKLVGGAGSPGLLVIGKKFIRNNCPMLPSGGTVTFASRTTQIWTSDREKRESGGSPNILGEIRCGLAFILKDRMQPMITKREHELVTIVKDRLRTIKRVKLLIDSNIPQLPIFPLVFQHLHYNLVVCLLSQLFGIQSRGGTSCNGLSAEKLLHINGNQEQELVESIVRNEDTSDYGYGWVRISFHFSMSNTITQYILNCIDFISQYGYKFKRYYRYDKDSNNWTCRAGTEEPFGDLDFKAIPPQCLSENDFNELMAEKLLKRAMKLVTKIDKIAAAKKI
jgi:selenocysteine lyase/cysteine desulfurase